ncbi:MAG: SatD family protein [Candidatus Methanoperedens sp.]|nr:SatD family protein [Candidatus Methanoperedens sp.]
MRQKLYVMMGDVMSSRKIKEKEAFRKKLDKVCREINMAYAGDIYADFRILKGIDEIEGVLLNISKSYEIMTALSEQLFPQSMRFVIALDYIDTALDTRYVTKMDGPAFHKASDMIHGLKKTKLFFEMSAGNEALDIAINGEVNLIMLLKKNWSIRQHQIVREYREKKNQDEVAKALGITQQSVSRTLKRCMWHEITFIEEKLNYVLSHYPVRRGDTR